jgi:hypothetical protein
MKKTISILVVIAALAVGIYMLGARAFSWLWADEAIETNVAKPWPGGLGTIDTVAARFPARQSNAAASKLTTLAQALTGNEAVELFVTREIESGDMTIGESPALVDVTPMRETLLGEEIVWARPGGVGEIGDQETQSRRVVHMTMARALVASALVKARSNDQAAWRDLEAVWKLAQSIDRQPQVMEQTAVLSMFRMINAVAWKMPLPAPAWFAELQKRDVVLRLLEAFQYQVASYSNGGSPMLPTRWHADLVKHDAAIADAIYKERRCDMTPTMNKAGVDLSAVWRRAFRYRAEREATANALRLREGRAIEARSVCSDGSWAFDGKMLRFSRQIAAPAEDRAMPLELSVKR